MKVILNQDVNPLGEEGDVKDVARGYARNYLFPRSLAVPYNQKTVQLFEVRRAEIEARKLEKRKDAASLKERLEALEITLNMPAGANGKLYGAVTNQTVADELNKNGFQIERKRVELPGTHFKSVGKYKVLVKIYENTVAEVSVIVQAHVVKTEEKPETRKPSRRQGRGTPVTEEGRGSAGSSPAEETPASVETTASDNE